MDRIPKGGVPGHPATSPPGKRRLLWITALGSALGALILKALRATFSAIFDASVDRAVPGSKEEAVGLGRDISRWLAIVDDFLALYYWTVIPVIVGLGLWIAWRAVIQRDEHWGEALEAANSQTALLNPLDQHLRELRGTWRLLNDPKTRTGRQSKTAADRLMGLAPKLEEGGIPVGEMNRNRSIRVPPYIRSLTDDATFAVTWEKNRLIVAQDAQHPIAGIESFRNDPDLPAWQKIRAADGIDELGRCPTYFLTKDGETIVEWQAAMRAIESGPLTPEPLKP